MTNKLIVRLAGGLGNQMFCYAAARSLAQKNHAELVIDDSSGFINDKKYKRNYALQPFNIAGRLATEQEKMKPFRGLRSKMLRLVSRQQNFSRRRLIFQEKIGFDSRLLDLEFEDTCYFEGVWPSEDYFSNISTIIRQDFSLKSQPDDLKNNQSATHILSTNSVALFVRWFDDPTVKDGQNTPADYYQQAISLIESRLDTPHYFIFSDQPEVIRKHLSFPDQRYTIINHNNVSNMAYADLWLGSLCQHFIIANSTFGWWAAWLGNAEDKMVIAPSEQTVTAPNWVIEGIVPEQWIRL